MKLIFQHKRLLAVAVCAMFVWASGVWFVLDMQIVQASRTSPEPMMNMWTNFWQSFGLWTIAGITAIIGLLCVIVAIASAIKSKRRSSVSSK